MRGELEGYSRRLWSRIVVFVHRERLMVIDMILARTRRSQVRNPGDPNNWIVNWRSPWRTKIVLKRSSLCWQTGNQKDNELFHSMIRSIDGYSFFDRSVVR